MGNKEEQNTRDIARLEQKAVSKPVSDLVRRGLDLASRVIPSPPPASLKSSSDGAMFRANLQRTGVYSTRGVHQLKGLKWKRKAEAGITSSLVVSHGTVYFGCDNGCLYAVDIEKGKVKWKFQTQGDEIYYPSVAEGMVFFGSSDMNLYALDAITGKEKWRFEGECPYWGSPAILDGTIYFGTSNFSEFPLPTGYLYALDIRSGKEKWKFQIRNAINHGTCPAIDNGVIYFSADLVDQESKPTSGCLYALEPSSGRLIWQSESAHPVTFYSVARGLIYFDDDQYDGWLSAARVSDGQIQWHIGREGWSLSAPSIFENRLFVIYISLSAEADFETWLAAIDANSGKEKWGLKLSEKDDRITSGSIITEGLIYFASNYGPVSRVRGGKISARLYAIDPQTKQEKWRFDTERSIIGEPVISEGVIYICTDDYLLALEGE